MRVADGDRFGVVLLEGHLDADDTDADRVATQYWTILGTRSSTERLRSGGNSHIAPAARRGAEIMK
jgi:hypothetical protein